MQILCVDHFFRMIFFFFFIFHFYLRYGTFIFALVAYDRAGAEIHPQQEQKHWHSCMITCIRSYEVMDE